MRGSAIRLASTSWHSLRTQQFIAFCDLLLGRRILEEMIRDLARAELDMANGCSGQ